MKCASYFLQATDLPLRTVPIRRHFNHTAAVSLAIVFRYLGALRMPLLIRPSSFRSSSIFSPMSVPYCSFSVLSPILCSHDFPCLPSLSARTYACGYLSNVTYDLLMTSATSSISLSLPSIMHVVGRNVEEILLLSYEVLLEHTLIWPVFIEMSNYTVYLT